MVQEIITYIIVGAAFTWAISKIIKRFRPKKNRIKNTDFKKESFSMEHNCSDCSAECMLRNSAGPLIKNNKDLCKKIEI